MRELGVNPLGHRIIGYRSRRRLDVGDQIRPLFVAGLRQMHFVACPMGLFLVGKTGVGVIGRRNLATGGRRVAVSAPDQAFILHHEVLHPHLAQNFHRRQLA